MNQHDPQDPVLSETGEEAPAAPNWRARQVLLKRLADVVCLPSSRVNPFERAMTADLLLDVLREADADQRRMVARRLANLTEPPAGLLRMLLRDQIEVATPLLADSMAISDANLIDCARNAGLEHRRLIAIRRGVSEVVSDVLIEYGEVPVIDCLLRNEQARLSSEGVETIVASTRGDGRLVPALLKRAELRPAHAYVLFWWADRDSRRALLQRFAVSREVLQDAAGDIFRLAAEEGWQDPLTRKALQFIERRQRNRAAIDKSPYDSLDQAILAAEAGLTREVAEEISYLSGVKPVTGARIMTDPGGEPVAILCKACGLPRSALRSLWRALRRPESGPDFEQAILIYDLIAVDRAQTVLRYWNWSLSSALSPALLKAIREGDEGAVDKFSTPERTAMLVLSKDLGR